MAMNDESISAECMEMCPGSECSLRQKQNLIHILETDSPTNAKQKRANPKKMIKMYCRSAAGQNLNKPELLRPSAVLTKTVNYIFHNVILDKRLTQIAIYDFVNDRFRAVKQDGVIQRLSTSDWFRILPPVVRFYVFSSYWFCETSNNFDAKLNRTQLLDCLLLLIKNYELNPVPEFTETYAEMEAIYLIVEFKPDNINRAKSLNLPNLLFQDTLNLITKFYIRNYCAVLRKLTKLPPLIAGLFCALHLTSLRKNIFQIMSIAYCSKNVFYPCTKLQLDLLYNSKDDVVSELLFYGIALSQDHSSVQFRKIEFPANCAPSKRLQILNERLTDASLPDLLTRNLSE